MVFLVHHLYMSVVSLWYLWWFSNFFYIGEYHVARSFSYQWTARRMDKQKYKCFKISCYSDIYLKPVDCTAVNEWWEHTNAIPECVTNGTEGKDHVKVTPNPPNKLIVHVEWSHLNLGVLWDGKLLHLEDNGMGSYNFTRSQCLKACKHTSLLSTEKTLLSRYRSSADIPFKLLLLVPHWIIIADLFDAKLPKDAKHLSKKEKDSCYGDNQLQVRKQRNLPSNIFSKKALRKHLIRVKLCEPKDSSWNEP